MEASLQPTLGTEASKSGAVPPVDSEAPHSTAAVRSPERTIPPRRPRSRTRSPRPSSGHQASARRRSSVHWRSPTPLRQKVEVQLNEPVDSMLPGVAAKSGAPTPPSLPAPKASNQMKKHKGKRPWLPKAQYQALMKQLQAKAKAQNQPQQLASRQVSLR